MRGLTSAPVAGQSVPIAVRSAFAAVNFKRCTHASRYLRFVSAPGSFNRNSVHRRKLRLKQPRSHTCASSSVQQEHTAVPDTQNAFKWATNVSRHGNVYYAIDETTQACRASFGDPDTEPTVALVFASSSYSVEFDRIIPVLRSKVPSLQHVIGCTVGIYFAAHVCMLT